MKKILVIGAGAMGAAFTIPCITFASPYALIAFFIDSVTECNDNSNEPKKEASSSLDNVSSSVSAIKLNANESFELFEPSLSNTIPTKNLLAVID